MEYIKKINGQNVVYSVLPSTYQTDTHLYLNFAQVSQEILEQEGFYPIVPPAEIPEGKQLGEPYEDAANVFTYALVDLPKPIWHKPELPIQLIISREVKRDWLEKKQEHEVWANYPEIVGLLAYIGNETLVRVEEAGILYIYLSFIYKQHRKILTDNGVIINGDAETIEIEII